MLRIALTAVLLLGIPTVALAETRLFLIVSGTAPVPIATFTGPGATGPGSSIGQCTAAIASGRRANAALSGALVQATLVCVSTN
jgi:hypothetical protein